MTPLGEKSVIHVGASADWFEAQTSDTIPVFPATALHNRHAFSQVSRTLHMVTPNTVYCFPNTTHLRFMNTMPA